MSVIDFAMLEPSSTVLIASFAQYFYGILLTITAILLILLVLVQRGRGGGLAGAFGGMGGQSAFGTKAGDTFTKITVGLSVFWLLLSVGAVKYLGSSTGPLGSATPPSSPEIIPGSATPGSDQPLLPPIPGEGAAVPDSSGGGSTDTGAAPASNPAAEITSGQSLEPAAESPAPPADSAPAETNEQ